MLRSHDNVIMDGICLRQRNNNIFLKLGMLLRRSWWNLLSSNVGWWYSRGANYVILAPLQSYCLTETKADARSVCSN